MKQTRTARTQKLLILVGEEGLQYESRDFKKLSEVIVQTYLVDKDNDSQVYEEYLSEMLCRVVREIPLKHHLYAGLTAQIRKWNTNLGQRIVERCLKELENSLSNLQLYESINAIKYLAQLMNISLLNSLSFFNIIDDLVSAIENEPSSQIKDIFITIFVRSLPFFASSLNEKMFHDFKKLMDRSRKHCSKNASFNYLYEKQQKGTHTDFSLMSKLEGTFKDFQQIQINTKLMIKVFENANFNISEYYQVTPQENDKLYEEFYLSEGMHHRNNIEQLIETFQSNKTILTQKLRVYLLNYRANTFMVRLMIESLFSKAIKNEQYLVESSIIINLCKDDEEFTKTTQQIIEMLFTQGENFNLDLIVRFAQIVSYILINWDRKWDWEKIIENQETFLKRKILLKIILQKITLLNDKYKGDSVEMFMPLENLKNQAKYKTATEMQIFEKFVDLMKSKADSEEIMFCIDSQSSYEVFLEALFQKTSLSLTHLNILMNRYKGVFEKYQKDYDWTLITKIRTFWKHSLFHRILYLSYIIQKKYCKYDSYVKYISKVGSENKEEEIWIKIELNQLHRQFGSMLK